MPLPLASTGEYLRNILSLALLAVASVSGLAGSGLVACGSVTGAPSGSQCFSAVDCAAGLVCIAKGSSRVCSNDLTSVETEIDAGGEGGDAATVPTEAASPAPGDSSATDAGSPRGVDATADATADATTDVHAG